VDPCSHQTEYNIQLHDPALHLFHQQLGLQPEKSDAYQHETAHSTLLRCIIILSIEDRRQNRNRASASKELHVLVQTQNSV